MNKILLIIKREYLSRVQKKSFIIMTILGPIIFAAFILIPTWMATMVDTDLKLVAVYDSTRVVDKKLPDDEFLKFVYPDSVPLATLKKELAAGTYYGVVVIDTGVLENGKVSFFSNKQPSMGTNMYISGSLKNMIQDQKLLAKNIPPEVIKSIRSNVELTNVMLTGEGKEEESNAGIKMWVAYATGLLIYFFVFMYGVQVMRGVIEEKTNRIVEVIVSSVRPFQLMMGKIVGIALVGLTQFTLWIFLTFLAIQVGGQAFGTDKAAPASTQVVQNLPGEEEMSAPDQSAVMQKIDDLFKQINLPLIILSFIFYFIGGYLLYGAMFAAVGSAVDNETDTQQFMMPITIPLVLGIFVMINTMTNPESTLSFWFSMIPFTSPIVMMARVAYGVPIAELILSMAILIVTFIAMTWLAGKIYRTGILMYGKKVNYAELWKWIRYKA